MHKGYKVTAFDKEGGHPKVFASRNNAINDVENLIENAREWGVTKIEVSFLD